MRLAKTRAALAINSLVCSIISLNNLMDLRLALVSAPILLALGWAGFNIGRAAVGQLQLMIKRSRR
ncbi:Photosystem II PsbY protein (chromatophore) [Paulinella micropora]|uniref:Photosystem II reaction center protein Y n=1 Tax=Paulinella micropora TaxID=1928728 RepID=A0A1L5YCY6_9EUKA|nr:hypothetical protein PMNZ_813 [Paulinella micropora]APP88567.1 hypothetical protein PCKR_806 [Paulinella micropora]AQX45334.1 hypothetical protein PFK_806 [Paulinella micropora]AXY63729.1 hypothetical protein PMNZ_813 [Paulinella micropora]BBL86553.1 Photosystem II PsbY protein [Paulinella micropora]